MNARFNLHRRLHTFSEGSGPQRDHRRPSTVAYCDQSGEIVPFTLRSSTRETTQTKTSGN